MLYYYKKYDDIIYRQGLNGHVWIMTSDGKWHRASKHTFSYGDSTVTEDWIKKHRIKKELKNV